MSTAVAISEAITDAQRAEAQALFEVSFHDIAPTAVPRVKHDPLYAPLVLCYRDPGTGELAGAALTCRSQVAVSMTMMRRPEYAPVMDLHSELDLMAVVPAFRGRGIGGMLIRAMEDRLRQRGVRSWFGNATRDLETAKLREFYTRHGFTVLPDGQPLPDLLGRSWVLPTAEQPAFFFYKQIKRG
ncbi:GNAT family N-acetyltransferase [Streptomyces chrestomyceticus]|uniref:GNAT family N-acetyltransferase n=1 Tax=Streptomyces chrestomyceticus TaxID=68185 RepID=UPI000AC39F56